ncbi:hypothetical protein [Streptomyces sp. NPDC002526]
MNYPCLSSRLIGRSHDTAALRSRMTGTADAALLPLLDSGHRDALRMTVGLGGSPPPSRLLTSTAVLLLLPPPQRLLAP